MIPNASRNGRVVLALCLVSLATIWSCRLPRLCMFDQCPRCPTSTANSDNPGSSDLSVPDAPFISWPLTRTCEETSNWTPGLVFVCDNNSGGIGNIRNFILTCIRYAIAAGATAITLPTIQTRSPENLADLFMGKKLPFSHFFDEEHFRNSLRAACPQITIYDDLDHVPGLQLQADGKGPHQNKRKPEMITPKNFGLRGGCDQRDLDRHSDLFGQRFHGWLAEKQQHLDLDPVGPSNPKLVRFNWGVQWSWPVYRDGPEFVATFGSILKFRPDIIDLGRKLVDALGKLLAQLDPKPHDSQASGFAGIHLRTESDALSAWPSFEDQASAYLTRLSKIGTSSTIAYLATGNETEASRLTSLALDQQQLQVFTKHTISNDSRFGDRTLTSQIDNLSWDQQALVDFVVLLYADYFLGVSPSSFSLNVALKRHLKRDGIYTRPWRVGTDGNDGRSWLSGRYDNYWDDWLFMFDSMWP